MVAAVTEDMRPISMTFQIAEVTKPLASVGKICDRKNLVVFDEDGGLIFNKRTGTTTKFSREHGVYQLRTWVKKALQDEKGAKDKKGEPTSSFTRQG